MLPREPVRREPVERRRRDDVLALQPGELVAAPNRNSCEQLEQAAGAGDDAVAAPGRQARAKSSNTLGPQRTTVGQCRVDHRELVAVGEERGRHAVEPRTARAGAGIAGRVS